MMVNPKDGRTCGHTSAFTCVSMYSYVCRFMCMHPYLYGSTRVCVFICVQVRVHMEAIGNLRCHFGTLSTSGFETETLTGLELTY